MSLWYRTVKGLFVLPVRINDSITVNLILDTGCRNLILFGKKLRKSFRLSNRKPVQFSGLGDGRPVTVGATRGVVRSMFSLLEEGRLRVHVEAMLPLADAAEAHRIGLVDEVVEDGRLRERARELAASIARHSPLTLKLIKQAVRAAAEMPLSAGLALERQLFNTAYSSVDREDGVRAILELAPEDGATRLAFTMEIRAKNLFMAPVEGMVAGAAERDIADSLERNRGVHAGLFGVRRLLRRIRTWWTCLPGSS